MISGICYTKTMRFYTTKGMVVLSFLSELLEVTVHINKIMIFHRNILNKSLLQWIAVTVYFSHVWVDPTALIQTWFKHGWCSSIHHLKSYNNNVLTITQLNRVVKCNRSAFMYSRLSIIRVKFNCIEAQLRQCIFKDFFSVIITFA